MLQVIAPVCPRDGLAAAGLLHASARLIKSWACVDAPSLRFLASRNQVDLVLLLTGSGPSLVLKQQTASAHRFNKVTYYDSSFASLLLAKALKNHGKIQGTFQDVVAEWVSKGSECVFFGTRRRQVREGLVEEVFALPEVQSLRTQLIAQATQVLEWLVISHDATYQTLFSVIGQESMAQKPGEAHALHTFVGRTGSVPGFSLQHTESSECFKKAVVEVLPMDARSSCQFVFTDSPSMVEGTQDVLPHVLGIGEDALHLVLRLEACTGEKRTAMSVHVLRMQLKFKQPLAGAMYHRGMCAGKEGTWTNACVDRDWQVYGKLPYVEHQDYLDDLSTVCHLFPDMMRKQNHKGRNVRQILESGGSHSHFLYLQNGSRIVHRLNEMVSAPAELGHLLERSIALSAEARAAARGSATRGACASKTRSLQFGQAALP